MSLCKSIIVGLIICLSQQVLGQENPHKELTLPCETCHTTTSFKEILFDHNKTDFPTTARHNNLACTTCHTIENFKNVASNCNSCHQDVHQAKMGGTCEKCHSESGWTVFNAEEIHLGTNFPIQSRHILLDCQSCHKNAPIADFALSSTNCESCHQQQYLNTGSPDHVSFSFSTDCQQCHQMMSWRPAFLPDHDALFFPIFSGEHSGEWDDCSTCHFDVNNPALFSCLDCHKHRKDGMDNQHKGIPGYTYTSSQCYACHPTGGKSEFREHDAQFFPIFSGDHKNAWSECSECHIDSNDRKVFSCTQCHEHNQNEMDNEHRSLPGYSYNSQDCYLCHPSGAKVEF